MADEPPRDTEGSRSSAEPSPEEPTRQLAPDSDAPAGERPADESPDEPVESESAGSVASAGSAGFTGSAGSVDSAGSPSAESAEVAESDEAVERNESVSAVESAGTAPSSEGGPSGKDPVSPDTAAAIVRQPPPGRASDEPTVPAPGIPRPAGPSAAESTPAGSEATQVLRNGRPPTPAPGDKTVVVRAPIGPSGTTVMPAVNTPPPGPPKWTARAQVRPAERDDEEWPDDGEWVEPQWQQPAPRRRRNLAGPLGIVFLTLVLLGVLAFGIGLIVRSQRNDQPVSTATTAATTTKVTTTTASSAPPPTTTPAAPPTTAPTTVVIPRVGGAGLNFNTAADQLVALGLQVVRADRSSTTVPAGQVIETNPAADTQVPPGSTVTLFVSSGPPVATPTPTPTPTPTAVRTP